MAEAYSVFASYLRFKEVLSDPLGHLYRAGEFDASGVQRAAWLRVFDRPMIATADVIVRIDPHSGAVTGTVDVSRTYPAALRGSEAVANGIAFDADCGLWVSDSTNDAIMHFSSDVCQDVIR